MQDNRQWKTTFDGRRILMEDNLKNEDNHKNEDELKNEDDLNNENPHIQVA